MRYRAADDFAILAGVAGVSRFEDRPWILPFVGFDWRVTDDLRVKTEAAEVTVDYRVSETIETGLVAIYDFRQYRLNDTGPLRGGAVRDDEVRLGAALRWTARPGMTFELEAGKIVWRELTFFDGATGSALEAETSSPYYVQFGMRLRF